MLQSAKCSGPGTVACNIYYIQLLHSTTIKLHLCLKSTKLDVGTLVSFSSRVSRLLTVSTIILVLTSCSSDRMIETVGLSLILRAWQASASG